MSIPRIRYRVHVAIIGATALAAALTGCGSSDSGASASGEPAFKIAFPADPGIQDVPLLASIEELNEQGWNIEKVVMNDQALQTEALATGTVQMAAGNATAALEAVGKGAKLVMLGERSANDWIVVSSTDITSCDQLQQRKVAYQSEASPSTLMLRTWLQENCPDAQPDMLIMEGSANRAAALVNGQIDATVVQVADWVRATPPEGDAAVHELAKLSESLGNLMASTYVSPKSWVDENLESLTLFFETLLKYNREYVEPAAFAAAATDLLPGMDNASAERIVAAYGDNLFFPDGGLTPERVSYTIDFLEESESVGALDPADVVDRRPLDAAIDQLS